MVMLCTQFSFHVHMHTMIPVKHIIAHYGLAVRDGPISKWQFQSMYQHFHGDIIAGEQILASKTTQSSLLTVDLAVYQVNVVYINQDLSISIFSTVYILVVWQLKRCWYVWGNEEGLTVTLSSSASLSDLETSIRSAFADVLNLSTSIVLQVK